jgi:hypothetical protein
MFTGKQVLNGALAAMAFLALAACSEAPKATEPAAKSEAKKEPEKAPEPVAAQSAFYEMYKPARAWAADVLPLSLASGEVPTLKNVGGKAAIWTAVFVSPSKREAQSFVYSVVSNGTTFKGVTAGGAQSWSGATPKSKPFQLAEFATNSDKAYETAFEKAQAWVKKHPNKKVTLQLGNAARFPAPVWFILWGDAKSGYAAYVNAVTGKMLK